MGVKEIAAYAKTVVESASMINGHTDKDWATIAAVKAETQAWAADFGRQFGQSVDLNPKLGEFMSKHNRGDREQAIAIWFERVASGVPGESFWAETALIGMYHASASVPNEHLLSLFSRIESLLLGRCVQTFQAPKSFQVYIAFQRVLGVAKALMVEAYEDAIITGVGELGLNDKLLSRMRGVAVKKMIDQNRATLPLMVWDDSLSVGVAEVDNQHKKLIDLLNLLHSSSISGKGNETLKTVLADLASYTVNHFSYEEKMLAEHGYPELAGHHDSHEKLTAQVIKFKTDFEAGRSAMGIELFMFLRGWLNGHIRGSDRHYGRYLNAKGVH